MLEVCQKLPQSVVGSVVTAAVAGVGLAAVKLLNDKLQHRLPVPLPGELLMVRVLALGRRGACCQAGERDPEASSVGGGGFLGLGPRQKARTGISLPRMTAAACPKQRVCLSLLPASPDPSGSLLQASPATPKVVSQSPLLTISAPSPDSVLSPAHWGHRHLLRRGPEAQIWGGCCGRYPCRVSLAPVR